MRIAMDIGSARAPEIVAGTLPTTRAALRFEAIRQLIRCMHGFDDRAWSIHGVFPGGFRDVLGGVLKPPHPRTAYGLVDAAFSGPPRPRIIYPQNAGYMMGGGPARWCAVSGACCSVVMYSVPLSPSWLYSIYSLSLFFSPFRCAACAPRMRISFRNCAAISGRGRKTFPIFVLSGVAWRAGWS